MNAHSIAGGLGPKTKVGAGLDQGRPPEDLVLFLIRLWALEPMDGLLQVAIVSAHYPETKSGCEYIFLRKGADVIKNRCSPISLVLSMAVCAFLMCTVSAQAAASAAGAPGSNALTANVRAVQPAVSGLFQVKSPRVWSNGVPTFLDTWDAFKARTSSASLNKAYAFTTIDGLGHEILYAGVERASSKRTASSSGTMLRTVPFASAAAPSGSGWTLPNAPKSTFIAERFMARHMRSESRKPEVNCRFLIFDL